MTINIKFIDGCNVYITHGTLAVLIFTMMHCQPWNKIKTLWMITHVGTNGNEKKTCSPQKWEKKKKVTKNFDEKKTMH